MALIKCPKCENLISGQASVCPHCGYKTSASQPLAVASSAHASPSNEMKQAIAKKLVIAAIIVAILASIFLMRGFYVKNVYENYSSSDAFYDYDSNVNAYVGGDAYNYIINGTYFAGFMALSGALYICAVGLWSCSLVLKYSSKNEIAQEKSKENLPII